MARGREGLWWLNLYGARIGSVYLIISLLFQSFSQERLFFDPACSTIPVIGPVIHGKRKTRQGSSASGILLPWGYFCA
jgi:hypothetical protein